MKRLAVAVLLVVWFALPACAQHASAHAGSSGHSAGAFHSSPSAPVFHGFSGHPGYAPSRPSSMARRSQGMPQGTRWISRSGARPPYLGSSNFRRPYVPNYGSNYRPAYRYGVPVWLAPYYLASPFDSSDDSSAPADNTAAEGYDEQLGQPDQPDAQEPPPWPGAPFVATQSQSSPTATAETDETVTLIFKDGRTPEQIHNYILTKGTIFVGDQYHRQISIEQLDLPATVQVNRELGADFHLPNGSR